jgi:hypothetical protein
MGSALMKSKLSMINYQSRNKNKIGNGEAEVISGRFPLSFGQ